MNTTHAVTHVDVADVTVTFHCEHRDDKASYIIGHDNTNVSVYLCGTPEQLGAFCDAIMRAVSAHVITTVERANRLAGKL